MNVPKQQTSKDTVWKDAKGAPIPYNRTTALERLRERNAHRILKQASSVSNVLSDLKEMVKAAHDEVVAGYSADAGENLKETKGNKQWYNFDRTIRIDCSQQDTIRFDDMLIAAAKEKLQTFLRTKLTSDEEFLVEIVTDAFQTTKGNLDPKRVLGLTAKRKKVRSPLFHEACDLIEKSIIRQHSKTYYRVALLNKEGGYDYINLDFSNA